MQLYELSLKGQWDKMYEAVNFEVAVEMANASTYDNLPRFAREHFEYADRISLRCRAGETAPAPTAATPAATRERPCPARSGCSG